jgi:Lecithin:cholesterol acyltransferase
MFFTNGNHREDEKDDTLMMTLTVSSIARQPQKHGNNSSISSSSWKRRRRNGCGDENRAHGRRRRWSPSLLVVAPSSRPSGIVALLCLVGLLRFRCNALLLLVLCAVSGVDVATPTTTSPTPSSSTGEAEQEVMASGTTATTTTDDASRDKGEERKSTNTLLSLFQRRKEDDDQVEDSMYDPLQQDESACGGDELGISPTDSDCELERYHPPVSTIETTTTSALAIDATCMYGGADPDSTCAQPPKENGGGEEVIVDKHWGSDRSILRMRDQLRQTGSGCAANITTQQQHQHEIPRSRPGSGSNKNPNRRPPILLIPGLASTRLVAWRFKSCPHHPLLSDIKVQDYVWLNINLVMQMSAIDVSCMSECLRLGRNQTDTDDWQTGCKLRPDEGLDAISSLSPGGIGPDLLVGGTNTVYAWLIQWLADNLGYDVGSIVGLPYDWRLSPDKMEQRDGFLTLMRRRIEAAVQSNGEPGIVVAHSMGNNIFRYFLDWLRVELQEEAYRRYMKKAQRRAKAFQQKQAAGLDDSKAALASMASSFLPGWLSHHAAVTEQDILEAAAGGSRHEKLWELAQMEGESNWYEWVENHIWTYVGLSAPLLGAVNPLRAVLSGENMGLPVTDADARVMELTFGSTHTVNVISTKNGFCDDWDDHESWADDVDRPTSVNAKQHQDSKLACLDDILAEIETSVDEKPFNTDPWEKHPSLKSLLRDRFDWDTNMPMIRVVQEVCKEKEKSPCASNNTLELGPKDVETGHIFTRFSEIWKEESDPLITKREQMRESFWDTAVPSILNKPWERPLIKHVIMAYGVDVPTEIAYEYVKTERNGTKPKKGDNPLYDGIPGIQTAYWETAGGKIDEERFEPPNFKLTEFWKKKQKRTPLREGKLHHSGDGSVPYMSLAWAHTWLLHAVRARRHSGKRDGPTNPLDEIEIRHRPEGKNEWVDGPRPKRIAIVGEKKVEESDDTGTSHPHGTKYKPEMIRYHNKGTSRTTGIEYSTTVIEALAVEHKETTRYDLEFFAVEIIDCALSFYISLESCSFILCCPLFSEIMTYLRLYLLTCSNLCMTISTFSVLKSLRH